FEPVIRTQELTAAIVFFFGGGWVDGTPTQFFEHCRYLASRGMVTFSAEYRVKNRHSVTPRKCVTDGKSAMRWVRAHAIELGLDPLRIAAGGGSAGGHVAACASMLNGYEEQGEDLEISSVPDALVLFNPVLDTSQSPIADRFGSDAEYLSPQHHIRSGLAPTIIFHGKDDPVVPYAQIERYTVAMQAAGNRCELLGFEGRTHGFFNYGRDDGSAFGETLRAADRFLNSLGFVEGEPTLR
ncbi:MAG: alpha/beta hydrolase, partial [Anaerolineales bacterium]